MNRKSKGINAERELIHFLWAKGWAACRVAGSGSMNYPSPDVVAGDGQRTIAIECKSCGGQYQYLTKKEIAELLEFGRVFGAEVWIGVKFDRQKWFFLDPSKLKATEKAFVVSKALAEQKGISFDILTK